MTHDLEVLLRFTTMLEAESAFRALTGTRDWPAWMREDAKAALRASKVHQTAVEYFIERIVEGHFWGEFLLAGRVSDSHRTIGVKDFCTYHRPTSWTKERCGEVFDEMFGIAYDATVTAAARQMQQR